jgi:hypothetical protein
MLRLALSRVSLRSTHGPYPLHRLFSNCRVPLMESESTGTHKDPVTGEMISKQYAYFPLNFVPFVAHRSALRRELKRRQKQRDKEAKRADNPANRPPAPNKDNATEEAANEEDLSPNVRWSHSYMRYNSAIIHERMPPFYSMLTNIIFLAIF